MNTFGYGVIEGFYGKQWSWSSRQDFASYAARFGFSHYIYAPKGDSFLRRRWREHWPQQTFQCLADLVGVYRRNHIAFGVGFSPLGLVEAWPNVSEKRSLHQKLAELSRLNPDILCILFDDMPGANPLLAAKQIEIVEEVLARTSFSRYIVCPSYYSFDPVLESVFGPMPRGYWRDLGRSLPSQVDIFWTGDLVCSKDIQPEGLERIAGEFGRAPFLWDNYPVNDGRIISNFLHIEPFSQRSPELRDCLAGHASNPMNQPYLSRIPLLTLAGLYDERGVLPRTLADALCMLELDQPLRDYLLEDSKAFQYQGLSAIKTDIDRLLSRYQALHHPMALEVCDWLQGHYRFDPECLTG